jgi:flagellar biosynthesis chaperone FliJ
LGTLAKVVVFQGMDLPTEKVEERKRELARQYEGIRKQCELIEQKIAKLFRERRTNEAKGRL